MIIYTVTIGTDTAEVYAGLAAVKSYLALSASSAAAAFNNLADDDARRKVLVDVTRWFDALPWSGTPTTPAESGTTLQWPRTGVTLPDGTAVDAHSVPADIVRAVEEACGLLAQNPKLVTLVDQGSNVQSLGAGPASISYFSPTSLLMGNTKQLPEVLDRLLSKFMGASASDAPGSSRGGRWLGASTPGCEPCAPSSGYYWDGAQYKRSGPF